MTDELTVSDYPSHYTADDIAWEQGGRTGPVPMVDAYCLGCGSIVRDCSGGIALCNKCARYLERMPLLRGTIYGEFHRGEKWSCGHRAVEGGAT